MYRSNLKLVRGIFGALVVGTLGFGASQAFASPTAAGKAFCTIWQRLDCREYCAGQGMTYVSCAAWGTEVYCECA